MIDYNEIFADRITIITGAGRSGTTILGKLIGSLANTIYLFEPAILKFRTVPPEHLPGILFEDYLLPILQCRGLNHNINQWTYYGNYFSVADLIWRSRNLDRRKDALFFINSNKINFVIKTNDMSEADLAYLKEVFPTVKIVNIVRNGLSVIKSSLSRGFYTDEYCRITPFFRLVDELKITNLWNQYNQATRCAFAWRKTVSLLPVTITYEKLLKNPYGFIFNYSKNTNQKITKITHTHISAIMGYINKDPNLLLLNEIHPLEIELFSDAMRSFGYELS